MRRLLKNRPLITFAIISLIALGWVVPQALRIHAQHRAVTWVKANAGYISYDKPDKPNAFKRWLRKAVGRHAVDTITHLTVRSPGAVLDPADIRALSRIPSLESLALNTTNLTPDHIRAIAHLTQVRELYLDESTITDADLETVSTFTNLTFLSLCETPVSDRGLAHLVAMPDLAGLDLSDTDLSAAGLAHVAKITNLEELHVARTPIGDDALHLLAPLTKLNTLHLGEHVTDAGMPHVASLPALRNLSLENCTVSNDGIALVMDSHPEFDYLHLFYTYVTGDKMAEIENTHPGILLQAAY